MPKSKNKLDGLKSKKATDYLIKSIDNQIDELTISINELENKVIELVKKNHSMLLSNIK